MVSLLVEQRVLTTFDVAVLLGRFRDSERGGLRVAAVGEIAAILQEMSDGIVLRERRLQRVPSNVSRVTKRWVAHGVVKRERLLQSVGPVFVPTQAAASLAGVERVSPVGVGVLEHAAAINRVRWSVEASTRLRWVAESELARRRDGQTHVPDGLLVDGEQPVAAVEVERTAKGPKRLGPLLQDLLRTYPRVLYVCASASVAEGVHRALVGAVRRPEDQARLLLSVEGARLPAALLSEFGSSLDVDLQQAMGISDRLQ